MKAIIFLYFLLLASLALASVDPGLWIGIVMVSILLVIRRIEKINFVDF